MRLSLKTTPHFPHSALSTLRTFHTPHFPHSSFSTLLIFHTPHFPHSSFSTLRTPHPALRVFHRTLKTARIFDVSKMIAKIDIMIFCNIAPHSVWTNLGKHSLFVWLFVFSVKTGTRRIIHLDELPSVVRLERRTTEDSSSRRIMRLMPVFTLETKNQTNNECFPKFVQADNESSRVKTAIIKVLSPRTHKNPQIIEPT